jgi:hypothetical protein
VAEGPTALVDAQPALTTAAKAHIEKTRIASQRWYSATRVRTSLRTSAVDSGSSGENRIVPLLVEYFASSFAWAFTGCAPG